MSFYDDASWLLIPSGIKEDIVFAQKPTSGLGDLTFTRASDATYTDSTGVVRRSPYNLLQQSNTFSNAIWLVVGTPTLTANYAPNPLTGANDAWRFVAAGTGDRLVQVISGSNSAFSLYVKGTGQIVLRDSSGNYIFTATLTSSWQRIVVSIPAAFPNVQFTGGPGGCDATIYAAQLVQGTEALDYFPTTNRQDVPRIDFRNADGTLSSCGRLLLEPQRTNLARYSNQFNLWTRFLNTTKSIDNSVIDPEGNFANKYLRNSSSVAVASLDGISISASTTYTFTYFAKKGDYSPVNIEIGSGPNNVQLGYNFDTGALTGTSNGSQTLISSSAQSFGNGWARITATFTGSLTSINLAIYIGNAINNYIYLFGAQLEAGAYPTTYIPTTTAAVTRIADSASKTGVSSLIGQTEGTLFVDIIPTDVTTTSAIGINNASTAGRVIIFTGSNLIFGQVRVDTVTQFTINTSALVGVRYKAALAYKGNDFAFYLNGAQIAVSNTGTVPACSVISYESGGALNPFFGRNNQAALFPTRLTNDQLAELTTL